MGEGTEKTTALVPVAESVPVEVGFSSAGGFDLMQRMAKLLAASALVPKEFQNNVPNVVIALEMSHRMNASPLAVMQNLYIVHGKPSWSSQFIIAAINSTGKFSPLRFRVDGEKDTRTCTAWATELATGEILESPEVSIAMAKAEGWADRNGSKWKTMPDLMMRYRAATFFGRLYAPEVLMGMRSIEETEDIEPIREVAPIEPTNGRESTKPEKPAKAEKKSKPKGKVKSDDDTLKGDDDSEVF